MSYSPNNFGQPVITPTQATGYSNTSGSTIAAAVPVNASATGIGLINISSQASVEAIIGLTLAAIANNTTGQVVTSGAIPAINSFGPPYTFTVGQGVWIDSTGQALTSTPPTIGSNGFTAGMFVVKVGTVQQNLTTPSQLDLFVRIENRGQL